MAADIPVKKRGRKPKSEVQQEFELIARDVEEEAASSSAKMRQMLQAQDDEVRNSVKDVTTEEVVRRFAGFRVDLSNIMGSLSDKVTQEIQLLSNLRQAVSLEQRELERLHKIDVVQTTIDSLVAEYAQRREELEAEMTATHEQWEVDQTAREAEVEEYDNNLAKTRKREVEEHEYKKNLERKKAQDKYDEELRLREKQNKDKQDLLERNWNEREVAIKDQEDELKQLRDTVNEFPGRIQQEVAKAAADAVRQTEQRLCHELALTKRDSEAEKRIAELHIKTMENQLAQQNARIAVMQAQLDEAKNQVQDIAVKAIEGASGARALSHINQIAIEQAKGRPGQV